MCAGLDEAEHLLCRHDCKEIREWRPGDRREEKMATRLEESKGERALRERTCTSDRPRRTLTNSAHDLKNAAGLSTCSTTSIEHTISNRFGSCTSVSAVVCRNDSAPDVDVDAAERARPGSAAAWRVAMPIFSADASMASVLAPRRARLYSSTSRVSAPSSILNFNKKK